MSRSETKNSLRGDWPQISPKEYTDFCDFLRVTSGITLGNNKQYLVTTRVRRILIEHNLPDLASLTERITKPGESSLRQKVVDVMTTNETFWFRDNYPFEYLSKQVVPEFAKINQGGKIKIWCAACSTGQEPYSISMLFEEQLKNRFSNTLDAEILATDVSTSALESARKGHYDRISLVRGLSMERTKLFFSQVDEETWKISDQIKKRVRFRPFNLQESYFLLGKFDVVFCRNVLIYFSQDLKAEILKKIHSALSPGGILFLGSSESISGLNDHFEMIHCNPGVAYRAKPLRTGF